MLEKTVESPLNCQEIKPVHPKGNQSWIFIGRTDAEAEAPVLWPPKVKSWLTEKDPDAGKTEDRRKEGRQRMRRLGGLTDSMDMGLSRLQERVKVREPGVLQSMGSQRGRHNWATEQLISCVLQEVFSDFPIITSYFSLSHFTVSIVAPSSPDSLPVNTVLCR